MKDIEIIQNHIDLLQLSIGEISDLFDCRAGNNSSCSGPGYFYAGYLENMTNAKILQKKKLVQPYKKKHMSTHEKKGWYLTELGDKVIDYFIKKYYYPYLEEHFKSIKNNVSRVWYCANHINFTLTGVDYTDFINIDPKTNKICHLSTWLGSNWGSPNFDILIESLGKANLILYDIQNQLDALPKVKSFIEACGEEIDKNYYRTKKLKKILNNNG